MGADFTRDALLRLLREPIVELRPHCRCQAG